LRQMKTSSSWHTRRMNNLGSSTLRSWLYTQKLRVGVYELNDVVAAIGILVSYFDIPICKCTISSLKLVGQVMYMDGTWVTLQQWNCL
jgi:hypothetical protein